MTKEDFQVQIKARGITINRITHKIKGLLQYLINRNPDLNNVVIDADKQKGILFLKGANEKTWDEYLRKTCLKVRTSPSWRVDYDFVPCDEDDSVPEEVIPSSPPKEIEKTPWVKREASLKKVKRHGKYSLLITIKVLETFSEVVPEAKQELSHFLEDLLSGKWEDWNENKIDFACWEEEEASRVMFTRYIEGLGVIIWERLQSVDLLGCLSYPPGSYDYTDAHPSTFRPHIVIYEIRTDSPEKRLAFQGRAFIKKEGLNEAKHFDFSLQEDQINYSKELFLLSKARVNDLLSGIQHGLPLHLSEEQIDALRFVGPVLLSGEAGSGKSSVIIQWLMINHLRHEKERGSDDSPLRQLFVTFSPRLRNKARDEFEYMLPITHRDHATDFKSYRDLLNEIANHGGFKERFKPENEMNFEKFMKEFSHRFNGLVDPVLLWDEIRAVIKGGGTAETGGFIPLPKYEDLSERRGKCKTPREMREKYYSEAQKYQTHLQRNNNWDVLDLVFACLSVPDVLTKYDRIACDEVQDLAPIEIILLTKLLKSESVADLFFTGDVAQVINPSGFEWARLKRDLGVMSKEIPISDLIVLRRNYRSCREIVDLVNEVLHIRKELLDDEVSSLHQEALLPSRLKPMILRNDPLESIKDVKSNPDLRLVLVKNLEEKEKVQNKLDADVEKVSILTIEEAKGLEWEGVLLYNFFIPRHEILTKNDWEAIFEPRRRERLKEEIQSGSKNPYQLTYEFNLLHVGLTRARKNLTIFDNDLAMRIQNLGGNVDRCITYGDTQDFRDLWKTTEAAAEDFEKIAFRLLERDTSQAFKFYRLAAREFEKREEYSSAAACYERAEAFKEAADCYKAGDDRANELRALAQIAEINKKYEKAGDYYFERGNLLVSEGYPLDAAESFFMAQERYEKGEKFTKASEAALQRASSLPMSQCGERAMYFVMASRAMERTKEIDKCITILNRAISEANKAEQRGDKSLSGGIPIPQWKADRHMEIARYHNQCKDYNSAAIEARKAAGIWNTGVTSIISLVNSTLHPKKGDLYLAYSIKNYIQAGELSEAKICRKNLLEKAESSRGHLDWFRESWSSFMNLYRAIDEIDEYVDCATELSKLYMRWDYKISVQILRQASTYCKDSGKIWPYLNILDELVKVSTKGDEMSTLAWAHMERGKMREKRGDLAQALDDFRTAGNRYLDARDISDASKAFNSGRICASQILKPSLVGRYCLNDVILENFIPRGHTGMTLNWVENASIHFAQDFDDGVEIISKLKEEQNSIKEDLEKQKKSEAPDSFLSRIDNELQEIEKIMIWLDICLAFSKAQYSMSMMESTMMHEAKTLLNDCFLRLERIGDGDVIGNLKKQSKRWKV